MRNKVRVPVFTQIDLKNATIYIKDGTSPANVLEVNIGAGNLTYSEKKPRVYDLDRGRLDTVKNGDEQPVDVSMDFKWINITGSVGSAGIPPTIEDALKNRANAAAWISSDSDTCQPYAVDLVVDYVPECSDGTETETITLPDFRYEELNHDLKAGTIACTGKCNVTEATAVRVPRSSGS